MTAKLLGPALLVWLAACPFAVAAGPETAAADKTVAIEKSAKAETAADVENAETTAKTAPAEKAAAEKPKGEKAAPAVEAASPVLPAEPEWWRGGPPLRLPIEVKAAGFDRFDKPVEVDLDFTELLASLGRNTALNDTSLRVVEIDEKGAVADPAVGFQFDRADDYSQSTRARGTLVFLMKGTTPAAGTRRFHVYFDAGTAAAVPFAMRPLILRHESVLYEGQTGYKIVTPTATYYYHAKGGAFAGMIDLDDNDWISYHTSGGAAGHFRGIPNLVSPGGLFRPGANKCQSAITRRGPIKLTIATESTDRRWACTWEIFPGYARLTVLRIGGPYWFLYEGTPAGKLDEAKDFVVRSAGEEVPLSQAWAGTVRGPEWVLFGSGKSKRALYLIRHEADALPDTCQTMDGSMVLFGFGRKAMEAYLDFAPRHFTIGFAEEASIPAATKEVESAWRPLRVVVESAQPRYPVKPKK